MQNGAKIIHKEYLDKIKIWMEISKENFKKNIEKYLKNNFHKFTINLKEKKYINK